VIKKLLKGVSYREHVLEWALEFEGSAMSDLVFRIARRLCKTVDINQCNTNRFYPLHQAVRRLRASPDFKEYIEFLLDHGVDPNRLDDRCLSPLQVLLFRLQEADDAIVWATETLLQHGANPMQGLESSKWTILLASHNLPSRICRQTTNLLLDASFFQITRPGITLPLSYGWQSRWLEGWRKACESISNWHDVRRWLNEGPNSLIRHSASVVSDVAVGVVAGKCIDAANAYIPTGDDNQLEDLRRRRNNVALAIGDCRKLGVGIEDIWYECLLKLCENIAEREIVF